MQLACPGSGESFRRGDLLDVLGLPAQQSPVAGDEEEVELREEPETEGDLLLLGGSRRAESDSAGSTPQASSA
jgi:hypothetical protein